MAYTFDTCDGNKYAIKITFGDILRIKEQTGIKLFDLISSEQLLPKIYLGDPAEFFDLLWPVISARYPHVELETFCESLDSQALESARAAFVAACVDFFQGVTVAEAMMETLPDILTKARQKMCETLRGQSGSSADTAE